MNIKKPACLLFPGFIPLLGGQVHSYLRTHENSKADVQEFLILTSSYSDEAVENIREALQFFTEEERYVNIEIYCLYASQRDFSTDEYA